MFYVIHTIEGPLITVRIDTLCSWLLADLSGVVWIEARNDDPNPNGR